MKYSDKDIAINMIETAIPLYNKENYISVIPLAAAADGFLGKQFSDSPVNRRGLEYMKDSMASHGLTECEIGALNLNSAANYLKHNDKKGSSVKDKEQAYIQARQFICRSIINYLAIHNDSTNQMQAFTKSIINESEAAA